MINPAKKAQNEPRLSYGGDGRFCLYLGSDLLLAENGILPDPRLARQTDRVPCQVVNPGLVRAHPRLCGHFQDLLIDFTLMTNVAMTKEVITNF